MRIDIPAWFTTSVGDALTLPELATPERSEIENTEDQVDVAPEHSGTRDLPAGAYGVVGVQRRHHHGKLPRHEDQRRRHGSRTEADQPDPHGS